MLDNQSVGHAAAHLGQDGISGTHIGELGVATAVRKLPRRQQRTTRRDLFEGVITVPKLIGTTMQPTLIIRR
jgi:hypothetical protein